MNQTIDNIIEMAKEIAIKTGKKGEQLANLTKLKYKQSTLNSELRKAYEKLGSSVYGMVKADYENSELVAEMVEDIDVIKAKLDAVAEQIADIQNVVICGSCNAKNSSESIYCSICGSKLAKESEVPEEE